jgi:hypothetical protein
MKAFGRIRLVERHHSIVLGSVQVIRGSHTEMRYLFAVLTVYSTTYIT